MEISQPSPTPSVSSVEKSLCEAVSNMSFAKKASVSFDSGSLALAREMVPDGCQLSKFYGLTCLLACHTLDA